MYYNIDNKHDDNFTMPSDCVYTCMIEYLCQSCIGDIKTDMQILLRNNRLQILTDNSSECNRTNEMVHA